MAHEMWKDIPFEILHSFDPPKAPWLLYFVVALCALNIMNSICYVKLSLLFRWIFEGSSDHKKNK